MSFAASSFGAVAFSGSANAADEQIFFPSGGIEREPDVLYEARALFNGSTEFYEVLVRQESEPGSGPMGVEFRVYTSPQEGITPQLQAIATGSAQLIIGADRIIIVTGIIDSAVWASGTSFNVRGRPYTQ